MFSSLSQYFAQLTAISVCYIDLILLWAVGMLCRIYMARKEKLFSIWRKINFCKRIKSMGYRGRNLAWFYAGNEVLIKTEVAIDVPLILKILGV